MGTLDDWREQLDDLESKCPWPGPRPMRDDEMLRGRDGESTAFIDLVRNNRLVLLDGKSGVGKSSLLQASLVPGLRRRGYAVAICNDWSDSGEAPTGDDPSAAAAAMLAGKIRSALELDPAFHDEARPGADSFSTDISIIRELDEDAEFYNRRSVIVLDQFEELIRYSPARAKHVLDIVAAINRIAKVQLVISLRSEYVHELRDLERNVEPFSYATYELHPLADNRAREVIEAPNTAERTQITPEAAIRLEEIWRRARTEGSLRTDAVDDIGLLHLQAALYALHWRHADAAGDRDAPIGIAEVEGFIADGHDADAVAVFEKAMAGAVDLKLQHCTLKAADLVSSYLLASTREYAARIAPHLSSGGFKLHREAEELCKQVLDDELKILGARAVTWWEPMLRALVFAGSGEQAGRSLGIDLFDSSWSEIAQALLTDAECADLSADAAIQRGEESATCGVFRGCAERVVLIEELRRFALAVTWMQTADLVRLSTPSDDRTMISLIHDRFGEGLKSWGDKVKDDPAGPFHAITAPSGAEFVWKTYHADGSLRFTEPIVGAPGRFLLVPNLRWRGAFVQADFEYVVFANCDLRGTLFSRCSLKGVAFLNCLLDGTIFDRCVIAGAPGAPLDKFDERPSSFRLGDEIDTSEIADAYGRVHRPDSEHFAGGDVFSLTPGTALRMGDYSHADSRTSPTDWEAPEGGVVVYGGRLSSLVLRGVVFDEPTATFAFRYVAGSGLDIVEHATEGRFEMYGSAIRHLTATPNRSAAPPAPLAIIIDGSALAQTWLSKDLVGTVAITDSSVMDLWNSSEQVVATITNSRYIGVFNAEISESAELDPSEEAVVARGRAMDYVRDPSVL